MSFVPAVRAGGAATMGADGRMNRVAKPVRRGLLLQLRLGIVGLAMGTLLGCGAAAVPVIGTVVGTGAVVYATQASRQSSAATLAAPPKTVYAGMLRLVEQSSTLRLVDSDPRRLEVEVAQDEQRLSAQATQLGDEETLLHIWVSGGGRGSVAGNTLRQFLNQLADELDVAYQRVDM